MKRTNAFETLNTDTELYVFFAGKLIYKKWKNTDQPSRPFNEVWPDVEITNLNDEK